MIDGEEREGYVYNLDTGKGAGHVYARVQIDVPAREGGSKVFVAIDKNGTVSVLPNLLDM